MKLDCHIMTDLYCGVIIRLTSCYGNTALLLLEPFLFLHLCPWFFCSLYFCFTCLLFSYWSGLSCLLKRIEVKLSELKDNWFYIYHSLAIYFLYKTFVLLVVDKAINLKLTYLNIIISLFSFGNVHVSWAEYLSWYSD
jgi:hypothetical protein